jgi:hypothetical protein
MPYAEAVVVKGLKFWVMAFSGELSMTRVFDEPDEFVEGAGFDEHAPSPAASRPAVATAISPLCLRCFVLIATFLYSPVLDGLISRPVAGFVI